MHLLDHGFPAYTRRWFDENTGHEVRMLGERDNKNRIFLPLIGSGTGAVALGRGE